MVGDEKGGDGTQVLSGLGNVAEFDSCGWACLLALYILAGLHPTRLRIPGCCSCRVGVKVGSHDGRLSATVEV